MPSRRAQIQMTPEEIDAFLAGRHVMSVATVGADGRPHLVAMWYGFAPDGRLAFWTYARSQKVVNLRRDPRLTCLVDDGERYEELRGVELLATGTLVDTFDEVLAVGVDITRRYVGDLPPFLMAGLEGQARKRIAVLLDVEKTVSWDHRKLGGTY